MTTKDTLKTE